MGREEEDQGRCGEQGGAEAERLPGQTDCIASNPGCVTRKGSGRRPGWIRLLRVRGLDMSQDGRIILHPVFRICLPEEGEQECQIDQQEEAERQVTAESGRDINANQGHAEARIKVEARNHFPADGRHGQHGDLSLGIRPAGEDQREQVAENQVQRGKDDQLHPAIGFGAVQISVPMAEGQDEDGDRSGQPKVGWLGERQDADGLPGEGNGPQPPRVFGIAPDAGGCQGPQPDQQSGQRQQHAGTDRQHQAIDERPAPAA